MDHHTAFEAADLLIFVPPGNERVGAMNKKLFACLCAVLLLESGIAQSVTDSDMIEYDRRLAPSHKTKFPTAGIVPDAETAKAIAMAVAVPIWGKGMVTSELPLRAGLKGNVWTVIGDPHLHGGQTGGELIIQIISEPGLCFRSFTHSRPTFIEIP